jgi:K+-sensing histidine kinase KdpD
MLDFQQVNMAEPKRSDPEPLAWDDAVTFIRQLGHDLRNHLNAAELQVALMNELTDDAELKKEIQRLREMLGTMTKALQKLSSAVVAPRPTCIDYDARELMRDLETKFQSEFPERAAKVQWRTEFADRAPLLHVDPQLVGQAVFELLENACRFEAETIEVTTQLIGNQVVVAVREKRQPPAGFDETSWGREPLRRLGHGHYSLGLNRVRMIAEAAGGEFRARVDADRGEFVSTIVLPVAQAET